MVGHDKESARKQLLVVAHCPSPNTQALLTHLELGIQESLSSAMSYNVLSPFDTSPKNVMTADAIILGTTENLGYMSGALKDFFDRVYYPVLEEKQGLPCAAFIRAGHDGTGTRRALETITTGLKWRWVQEPLTLRGNFNPSFKDEVYELGAAMTCALEQGII